MNQNSHVDNEAQQDPLVMSLQVYAETNLPTEFGTFRTVVFLDEADQKEHLALVYGDVEGKENVLIRMHSECFTGEVLHSYKCDCREQLHAGMQKIAESGCGILIYLRQEGRGIGLGNKIRAYALQEQGYDTVDANRMLGFGDDLRTYDVAFHILKHYNIKSVRVLTNNPSKLQALEKHGIVVTERVPLHCPVNPHSLRYFQAKQARMGHMFDESQFKPTDTQAEKLPDIQVENHQDQDPEPESDSDVQEGAASSDGSRPRHSTLDSRHLNRQHANHTTSKANGHTKKANGHTWSISAKLHE